MVTIKVSKALVDQLAEVWTDLARVVERALQDERWRTLDSIGTADHRG
jgi:hypothetical protein